MNGYDHERVILTSPVRPVQAPRFSKLNPQDLLQKSVTTFKMQNVVKRMKTPQLKIISEEIPCNSSGKYSASNGFSVRQNNVMRSLKQLNSGEYSLESQSTYKRSLNRENSTKRLNLKSSPVIGASLTGKESLIQESCGRSSIPLSQKDFPAPSNLILPSDHESKQSQNEELLDSNDRCVEDPRFAAKFPLFLTYPSTLSGTQKKRSIFSRSKFRKQRTSPAKNVCRLTGVEDNDIYAQITPLSKQKKQVMPNVLEKIPDTSRKRHDMLMKMPHISHKMSDISGKRPDISKEMPGMLVKDSTAHKKAGKPYKRSANKKSIVTYICTEGARSPEKCTAVNTPHKKGTRKRKSRVDFAASSPKPSWNKVKRRDLHISDHSTRGQKCVIGNLQSAHGSYRPMLRHSPLMFEVFAPRTINEARIEPNKASFGKRRRIKRISVSKDAIREFMKADMMGDVNATVTSTDVQNQLSSMKTSFSKKRKRLRSDILKNEVDLDKTENDLPQGTTENDRPPGVRVTVLRHTIKENDRCQRYKEKDTLLSIAEKDMGRSINEYNMRQSMKENETSFDITEHGENSMIPSLRTQIVQEMSRAKALTSRKEHKSRTHTAKVSVVLATRPESIRMVESLMSVIGTNPTDNSPTLGLTDSSLSRAFLSKGVKSIVFSLPASEADKRISLNTTTCPSLTNWTKSDENDAKTTKTDKRSLRFAVRTKTQIESDSLCVNATILSPNGQSTFSETLKSSSDHYKIEKKTDKKINAENNKGKSTAGASDDPLLLDNLILNNQNTIKTNTLLLSKSAKTKIYQNVNLQGSGSVRVSRIKPRTSRFPTLTSFLDNIEKTNLERNHSLKRKESARGQAAKEGTEVQTKTAEIMTKQLDRAFAYHHAPKINNADLNNVQKQKGSAIDLTCPHLHTVANQQENQPRALTHGDLHFGTNDLKLYSESLNSVRCLKDDNENVVMNAKLLPQRLSDRRVFTKFKGIMKNNTIKKPEILTALKKPKTASDILGVHKKSKKADFSLWKKDVLKNMKKDLNKKISKCKNKSVRNIKSAVLESTKSASEKELHQKHGQAKRTDIRDSNVKLKRHTNHEDKQSISAIPDPTRGSEKLLQKLSGDIADADAPSVWDALQTITEYKVDESKETPASVAKAANNPSVIHVGGSFDHKLKQPKSGTSFELSSPCRSWDFAENSGSRTDISRLGLPPATMNKRKNVRSYSDTFSLHLGSVPFQLNDGNIENVPCEGRKVDSTPPRARNHAQKLKTYKFGQTSSSGSSVIAGTSKRLKEVPSRDADHLSASKSGISTDGNVAAKTDNADMGKDDTGPVVLHDMDVGQDDTRDTAPVNLEKLSTNSKYGPGVQVVKLRREVQRLKQRESSLKQSEATNKKHMYTSFSHSPGSQTYFSGKNGPSNDTLDRYLVHTANYTQRHAATISGKNIQQVKYADGDLHCSSTDPDVPAKSPVVRCFQAKPEALRRSFPSYTSKYRANDNTDKSLKSPWRGTVAFRKRLQHLLQHNSHLQNKYKRLNMVTHKSSCSEVNPHRLNILSLKREKLLSVYKTSKIARTWQGFPRRINESKNRILDLSTIDQIKNSQQACQISAPISQKRNMQDKHGQMSVLNKNDKSGVSSVNSQMMNIIKEVEGKSPLQIITSPAKNNFETLASSNTTTESPKPILTHSDLFEQSLQSQMKRHKEELENKLKRVRGIATLTTIAQSSTYIKPPASPTANCKNSVLASCTPIGHKVNNIRSHLSLSQRQTDKCKGKQEESGDSAERTQEKDLAREREHVKSVAAVTNFPYTRSPTTLHLSSNEGVVVADVTVKKRRKSYMTGFEQDSNKLAKTHFDTTPRDLFNENKKEICSRGDRKARELETEDTKTTYRVTQAEHNLQQLLDKIKQRSLHALITRKDEDKENELSSPAFKEKSDVTNAEKNNGFNLSPSLRQPDNGTHLVSRPPVDDASEITEQTRSICVTEKNASEGTATTQNDSYIQSSANADTTKIITAVRIGDNFEKEQPSCLTLAEDINLVQGEENKRDLRAALKREDKLESKAKDSSTMGIRGQDNHKSAAVESTKKDAPTKVLKTKIMRSRGQFTTKTFPTKRNITPRKSKICVAEGKGKVVVSTVKHVAFNLNTQRSKCEAKPTVLVKPEVTSQETIKFNHFDQGCIEISKDDADMFDPNGASKKPFDTKVRQVKAVCESVPAGDTAEKDILRPKAQVDPSSETGNTMEKQEIKTTEVTSKAQCSSGYGTMDTLSSASPSHLHNSCTMEPVKLTCKLDNLREIVVPSSHKFVHEGIRDCIQEETRDHTVLPAFMQDKILHECCDRAAPYVPLPCSFWKKDLHMDVIPEEVDVESGYDNHADVNSAVNSTSGSDATRCIVKETAAERRRVSERKANSPASDKASAGAASPVDNEENDYGNDASSSVKTKVNWEGEERYLRNIHPISQGVDEKYLAISRDKPKSSLTAVLKGRNYVTVSERERNLTISQRIQENKPCSLTVSDVSAFSQPKEIEATNNVDQDLLSYQEFHIRVSDIAPIDKCKATTQNKMWKLLPEQERYEQKLPIASVSQIHDVDADSINSEHQFVTYVDRALSEGTNEAQTEHLNDGEQSRNVTTARDNAGSDVNLSGESGTTGSRLLSLHTDSFNLTRTVELPSDVSQSKSKADTPTIKHEKTAIDSVSGIESGKQYVSTRETNKRGLITFPVKSTFSGTQETFKLHNAGAQSPDNFRLPHSEETNIRYSERSAEESHKPGEQAIAELSNVNEENSSFHEIKETPLTVIITHSSSQSQQSSLEEESTCKKFSEFNKKRNVAIGDYPGTLYTVDALTAAALSENVLCQLKSDTKIKSFGSEASESIEKCSCQTEPVCFSSPDNQSSSETKYSLTTKRMFYRNHKSVFRKSVGLQVGDAKEVGSAQPTADITAISTHNSTEIVREANNFRVSSKADELQIHKEKFTQLSTTKSISRSDSKVDFREADQDDKETAMQIQKQNIAVAKDRHSTNRQLRKEHSNLVSGALWQAETEKINADEETDDLESLLNKELSQTNAIGGLRQGYELNRLFGLYSDRSIRRDKWKRRTEKSSSQLFSQRELNYHFLRENDGSLKGTSSNTSQLTVFSPSDVTIHHSSRHIRPLAPGRVTKLEEFLQKAEETNRTETMSNISRAVSKLSSFTSVTPSSQDQEQLQTPYNQTDNRNKAINLNQSVSERSEQRILMPSNVSTGTTISPKSSGVRTVQQSESNQWQHNIFSTKRQKEDNDNGVRISNTYDQGQSRFQTCQSDHTQSNRTVDADADGYSWFNAALDNATEQSHERAHERKTSGPEIEVTVEKHLGRDIAWVSEDTQQIKERAGMTLKTHRVKEMSADRNIRTSQVSSSLLNLDIPVITEYVQSAKLSTNASISQTAEENSALSSSSSSIVLSWIGSDMGDMEENTHITSNIIDNYGTLYSDVVVEQQSNCRPNTAPRENENGLLSLISNEQQLHDERESLPQGTFPSDRIRMWKMATSNHVTLKELNDTNLTDDKRTSARSSQMICNRDLTKSPLMCEDIGHSGLTSLNQSNEDWVAHMTLPGTENPHFECHKKPHKCANHLNLASTCLKCPQRETDLGSEASVKTPKQFYAAWNDHPRECAFEQTSYFNALFRDPKWNPSFDLKEDKSNVDQYTGQPSSAGNYVQSAWTYQYIRSLSPSNVFTEKEQHESYEHSTSTKLKTQMHEQPATHPASSSYMHRSPMSNRSENSSPQSNVSDPFYRCHVTTKMSAENAVTLPCALQDSSFCYNEQELRRLEDTTAVPHFRARGIEKQNTFLRKVHFGSNSRLSDKSSSAHYEPVSKSRSLARTPSHESKDKSKERISLDEHLKASSKSENMYFKDRFSSEQQSRGTDPTRTRTKVSLRQHRCSNSDAGKNMRSRCSAAQPASENGAIISTSSHDASLNWYKPQSLPSSTSVSNGNTAPTQQDTPSHQETPGQQETPSQEEASSYLDTPRQQEAHCYHETLRHQETPSHQDTPRQRETPRITRALSGELETAPSYRIVNTRTSRQDGHIRIHGPTPGQNLASSSPGNTLKRVNSQRNTRLACGVQHGALAQNMTLSLTPQMDKVSSENLLTSSSASVYNTDKCQTSGFRRLRESITSTSTRHTLLSSPSGNSNRLNGRKSTRVLSSASDISRGDAKSPIKSDVKASAKQPRGPSHNNGKTNVVLSSKRSYHSLQDNSQKKSDINSRRTASSQTASAHVPVLKRTRGSTDSSTNQTREHTSGKDNSRETTTNGTRQRLKASSKSSRDSQMSESRTIHQDDSTASPLLKSTKRVSRLVEMFEKRIES